MDLESPLDFDLVSSDLNAPSVTSQNLLDEAWDFLGGDDVLSTPDLLNLNLDSNDDTTDISSIDLLEEKITSTRNGETEVMSTVSQFTGLLSRTGIHGPRHLKAFNLKTRAVKIGNGAQFTVFREMSDDYMGNEGLVIKRVNVPFSREEGRSFASGSAYRLQLRTLELEVLALCNPLLRDHRNIVRLVAWGYDYPFPDTPVPVLFMEAALMTLTVFLEEQNEGLLGKDPTDIRYQLALDVTAGLEALHRLQIVHGDVKPDNVLVFKEKSDKVPFCAKISDFGVCIDMESPRTKLTVDDYRGTPAWLAPEVRDISRCGAFKPDIMFRFDSYSLGLVLVSIFTNRGAPLNLSTENVIDKTVDMLRSESAIPSALRMQLTKAVRALLGDEPWRRALPSPDLLKTDTSAFTSWLSESQRSRKQTLHVGTIDPANNKGPLFWYRLDIAVLSELEDQYATSKTENTSPFPGDVLFGMAQTVTGMKPSYLERLLEYVTKAAKLGFSPARAVCAQILHAHGRKLEFDEDTLDKWTLQAIAEGYLFARPSSRLSKEELDTAWQRFRDNGGFCADEFIRKPYILQSVRDGQRAIDWQTENKGFVDRRGNTMLHVAAALGSLSVVQALIEDCNVAIDIENDNHETPLYKACQAGHVQVINYLLDKGAKASKPTKREKLTALHWLFTILEPSIRDIATRLVRDGGASVNATMVLVIGEGTGNFAQKTPTVHFPFELPLGTPLHWAAFSRNKPAMEILLELGANIDETDVVRFLLSKGANGKLKDAKGRNTLHYMTNYFPDLHGCLPHAWHYWIRHGNWDEHLKQMSELAKLLAEAGADVEARDGVYPPSTPIITAASLGVWDGGAICALLGLGADVNDAKGSSEDTVLHTWASITGPRLDYPESYLYVFKKVAEQMKDVDVRNQYDEDTPLHVLVTIYHSEEEMQDACDILLGGEKPANINAANHRGQTPLYIALGTNQDPERRALYIAEKGASFFSFTDEGKDIFFQIASNKALNDQESYDLINRLLSILVEIEPALTDPQKAYETYFLPNPGAIHALCAAVSAGRVKTTKLLLDLGLRTYINSLNGRRIPLTALDYALDRAEISRRAYMELLPAATPHAARTRALALNSVYDISQGGPARAAEAYWGLPEVIRLLRSLGAKRACELEPLPHPDLLEMEYVMQPGLWDLKDIYDTGYTPETQPHKDKWDVVYELARYPADWEDQTLSLLEELYEDGSWRPHVKFLEGDQSGSDGIIKRVIGMLAKFGAAPKDKSSDSDKKEEGSNTVWIEASDHGSGSNSASYVVEVELLDGRKIGAKRRKRRENAVR